MQTVTNYINNGTEIFIPMIKLIEQKTRREKKNIKTKIKF